MRPPGPYPVQAPGRAGPAPSPDALVVAPATFNTVNKWAQGISDTLALGLLNEAVGLGLPMIVAPWPNAALAAHPVFIRSVGLLREWGVTVLLDLNRLPPAPVHRLAGPADSPAQTASIQQPGATFPWDELRALLPSLRPQMAAPQNPASQNPAPQNY